MKVNNRAKLTPEKVREIRWLWEVKRPALKAQLAELTEEALGRRFGAARQTIHHVISYASWRWVR